MKMEKKSKDILPMSLLNFFNAFSSGELSTDTPFLHFLSFEFIFLFLISLFCPSPSVLFLLHSLPFFLCCYLSFCLDLFNSLPVPVVSLHINTLIFSCFLLPQDGSCNGLQHYAALGRDVIGATSVNLVPCDVPQDVYSGVAQQVSTSGGLRFA